MALRSHERETAMRLYTRAVAIFVIALLLPAAASADDLGVCESESMTVPVSAKLGACTRLIDSGSYAGRDLAPIMLGRGNAYYERQDYPRAIADFDEAAQIDPTFVPAFFNRGLAYEGKGDLDRAVADYGEVIRLDPINAHAFNNRGNIYFIRKNYDSAIADFSESIRIYSGDADSFSARAAAYEAKGDRVRATADRNSKLDLERSIPNPIPH
jgi:tetratricopeptide (TPR) repeat protein